MYCRKMFASYLIKSGIDANTVDMLQGRCPSSILLRHYQVPDLSLKDRVLTALHELENYL
jgi:intergrase/recombinase